MSRQFFLDLAARGHRMPIGTDLILHQQPDPERILLDGDRLGRVVAQAAADFRTPVGLMLMDLKVEKAAIARSFGIAAADTDTFHFAELPAAETRRSFLSSLASLDPTPRMAANLGALRHLSQHTKLVPAGMSIGPFSLLTKLMADPITPVFLAGSGLTAEDESEVALLEACLEISLGFVLDYIRRQIDAGAKVMFIAEPAANKVYLSPKQLEGGSDILERFVLEPNRRIAEALAARGVDHVFHCCGELVDPILDGFCTLRPAMLSLGSSRRLGEDAARVPKDTVLYGNLPSKQFYSDSLCPAEQVPLLVNQLATEMQKSGHPFILGTECDTLHVPGTGDTILRKVRLMLEDQR